MNGLMDGCKNQLRGEEGLNKEGQFAIKHCRSELDYREHVQSHERLCHV